MSKQKERRLPQATIALPGERATEQQFGAVVSPVFHSSTFAFHSFAELRHYSGGELRDEYFYSRYANPTVAEVERKIAELEKRRGLCSKSIGLGREFLCSASPVRLALRIEAAEDVIADITNALESV